MQDWAYGMNLTVYVQSLDGRWQMQWFGVPPYASQSLGLARDVESLGMREGYLVFYALDDGLVYDNKCRCTYKRYGRRKFMWKARFRLHTEGNPWSLEYPVEPAEFAALQQFPWEAAGVEAKPFDWSLWGALNNTATLGPIVGCFQQDADEYRRRGSARPSGTPAGCSSGTWARSGGPGTPPPTGPSTAAGRMAGSPAREGIRCPTRR